MTSFRLLTGTKLRKSEDLVLKEILVMELQIQFDESRNALRQPAKLQISKIQNSAVYAKKEASTYAEDDLVAIRSIQLIPRLSSLARKKF